MAVTLSKVEPEIKAVAEIVKYGEKLILPESLSLPQAIDLIKRRMAYELQDTRLQDKFNAFPLDGAVQLEHILNERYGWAAAIATPGFFGDNPPALLTVEVAPGEFKQVPWGRFALPNVEGWLQCYPVNEDGRYEFGLVAEVKRRDEKVVKDLFDALRERIKTHSIYRGQAIRIGFLDDEGDQMDSPIPKFLDTKSVDAGKLVLSDHLERAVQTNLFTPITRTADCMANGIAVKRGVLLGGTFGTGKTMIAHVASKLAVEHGITFVYIQKAEELSYAIEFARQYQSPACVIFCEDIDRELDGQRDADMDAILNTIDGIDSKTSNIIVVLTTNAIEKIHPAMLRPGRLDAVIDVTAPDAKAIERLVRVYASGALEDNIDLTAVGEALAGNIPAVIAEVVKRAKLAQLSMQDKGTIVSRLSGQALLDSALTIQAQVALLNPKAKENVPALEGVLGKIVGDQVRDVFNGSRDTIRRTARNVEQLHDKLI